LFGWYSLPLERYQPKGKTIMNNVVVSPQPHKTSERIDTYGNVINPITKKVIIPNMPEYVPTQEEITKFTVKQDETPVTRETSPLSIQEQIEQAKKNLVALEELKQLKIKEMEAQLELLKQ